MAGDVRRLLGTISFLGLLASSSAGIAQTGRAWVDPPPEGGSQPQTSAPSATQPAPAAKPAQSKPRPASPEQTATTEDKASAPPSSRAGRSIDHAQPGSPAIAPQQKTAEKQSPSRTSVVERKKRVPMKAASVKKTRQRAVVSRSAPERGTRFRTVQEGIDSGLEVMRLRTIEFPDGRRITILTKPEPSSLSELAPPY